MSGMRKAMDDYVQDATTFGELLQSFSWSSSITDHGKISKVINTIVWPD